MEGGEDVVEEVLYICAETVEIALRGPGQIGAALYFVAADSEAVVAEVGGEPMLAPRSIMMIRCDMMCETDLGFRCALPQVLRGGQPYVPLEHMRLVIGTWTI